MKMENDLTRRELARYGGSALAGAYVAGLVDPDVPFANAARFTDGTPRTDLEFAMKFAHPEKLLGGFPGIDRLSDSAKAKLFGTSLRRYRAIRDGYRRNARRAAKQLLGDRSVATGVDRLPFKRGDTVVARRLDHRRPPVVGLHPGERAQAAPRARTDQGRERRDLG